MKNMNKTKRNESLRRNGDCVRVERIKLVEKYDFDFRSILLLIFLLSDQQKKWLIMLFCKIGQCKIRKSKIHKGTNHKIIRSHKQNVKIIIAFNVTVQ